MEEGYSDLYGSTFDNEDIVKSFTELGFDWQISRQIDLENYGEGSFEIAENLLSSMVYDPGEIPEFQEERGKKKRSSRDLTGLAKYLASKSEKDLKEGIDLVREITSRGASPEISAAVEQFFEHDYPDIMREIGKKIEKIKPEKGELSFELDVSGVLNFIDSMKNKSFLDKKDLMHIKNNIVYSRVAMNDASNIVNDILEEYMIDATKSISENFALFQRYNSLILLLQSRLANLISRFGIDRRVEARNILNELEALNVDISNAEKFVEEVASRIDEFYDQLQSLDYIVDNLVQDFENFLNNKKTDMFVVNTKIFSELNEVLLRASNLSTMAEAYSHETRPKEDLFKRKSNEFLDYDSLEALMMRISSITSESTSSVVTIFGYAKTVLVDLINNINNFTSFVDRFKNDEKMFKEGYAKITSRNLSENIKKLQSLKGNADWYEMSSDVISKYMIDYSFSISEKMFNDLRTIGMSPDLINELKSSVSQAIFERPGLDVEVSDYITRKVLINVYNE